MTAPLGPTQRMLSGTVIKAAEYAGSIAAAPMTQKVVTNTANALVDNKVGRWGVQQVDNIADVVASAPVVQQAAAKAEGLVTNVLNSSPVMKDLAVGLFNKVRAFIRASNLKSPPVKAFEMGEDALENLKMGRKFADTAKDTIGQLRHIHETVNPGNNTPSAEAIQEAFGMGNHALEMIKAGKSEEEILIATRSGLKILEDSMHTPASTNQDILATEMKAKVLGVELRAADNPHFANSAFNAIIKMNSQGIEVPRIRLSNIFPNIDGHADPGYTNHETMPLSKVAIFFNAKAKWIDAAKMSQYAFAHQYKLTSSSEHEIYHSVGRTMYNGSAGSEKLTKSNAIPERLRLDIQGKARSIETPEDFMGEMFAHIMVNGQQKEMEPYYITFRDWGGQFPRDFLPPRPKSVQPTQQGQLPKAPSPLDYQA